MKKNEGITMLALTISIIILVILASVTMYYGSTIITESKRQDMKTNMLLIQASLKSNVEKYNFEIQTVSDEASKEEIKSKYLVGIELGDGEEDENDDDEVKKIKAEYRKVRDEVGHAALYTHGYDFYYLNEATLKELGLVDVKSDEKNGYYIVGYSIDLDTSDNDYTSDVQVLNTQGFDGSYTLTQFGSD